MRILYGIVGVGLGHATRSTSIISHLKEKHEIRILTSGEAYSFLQGIVPIIYKMSGLQLVCRNNEIKSFQTLIKNILHLPLFFVNLFRAIGVFLTFKPQVVLCDFDSMSGYLGKLFGVPIINVDNIHITTMGEVQTLPKRRLNTLVTRLKTPFSDAYLIPSFFEVPLKDKRAKIFPPLVRKEITSMPSIAGEHILIYQKPENIKDILPLLRNFPTQKFIVYGYDQNKTLRNVKFKKTSNEGFLRDLASSKGVIARGGLLLTCEALTLHKPILSIPIKGHFEQETNAFYVEKLGYGMKAESITQEVLAAFFKNLSAFQQKVKAYKSDNSLFFRELERLLNEI